MSVSVVGGGEVNRIDKIMKLLSWYLLGVASMIVWGKVFP